MKNRQKFTVSEKSLLTKIERFDRDVDKKFLELRAKKKIASNPLIQKNIAFLQTYNNLFRGGSSYYCGDADSYFRKSLRSYSDSLDIIRDLNLESSPVLKNIKAKKQRSALTQHHCEDHRPLLKPEDFTQKKSKEEVGADEEKSSVRELFTKSIPEENFGSSTESEDRDYFSPLSELRIDSEDKAHLHFPEEQKEEPEEFLEASDKLQDKREEGLTNEQDYVERKRSLNIDIVSSVEDFIGEEILTNLTSKITTMAEEYAGEDMDDEYQAYQDTENEEEGDDELKDVEQMIQQASEELQKVAEENQQMMETLEEGQEDEALIKVTEGDEGIKEGGDGSYFKFDPAIDAAVLKELEEAEKQAKATARIITELKDRVGELLQKEKMTEAEAKELEEKNKTLKAQMMLFEEKTKRIQFLLGQANLFDKMIPVQPPLQTKHAEDILPKMLVCGMADDFMPKIVLCQNQGKKEKKCRSRSASQGREAPAMNPIAQKLDQSYYMQERLVTENADLEGNRYKLQSDLINKDQTVECLQRQLCAVQNEMRMVYQENAMLNEQMQGCPNPTCPKNSRSNSPNRGGKMSCGPGRGLCPADVENRLQEYSNTTNQLEKQLVDVEQEVRNIHQELLEVQKEREHLEHHRKMLALQPPPCPAAPCPPYPCMPPPCGHPPCPPTPCPRPPPPCCPPEASGEDQQVKEIKEKYKRLQEDFKAKVTEIASLRTDNEKLKELAEKAEENRAKLEQKVKELDRKLKDLKNNEEKGTSKEMVVDLQQQLKVHKELYRQAQDELEELRALVEDIQGQLNDYRNKYLEAIQTVEEQRRQIEIMRMENNRISEQVNLEIMRVKNQFQEKLQELAPLPDILKATQLKLQEAQQMHLMAERNNEALARELQMYKDKLQAIEEEMALNADNDATGAGEKAALQERVNELEQKVQEMQDENDELRLDMDQLRETADENEKLANEKLHEITQLESQLESVREDSARQISRIKDRCEIVRKSMQNQINDLERQLAQTKAGAKAAEKERDDIRQKMQAQIRNLNENFEDAQMRIRNLQGHVNFLKNSGAAVATEMGAGAANQNNMFKSVPKPDPCCCPADY